MNCSIHPRQVLPSGAGRPRPPVRSHCRHTRAADEAVDLSVASGLSPKRAAEAACPTKGPSPTNQRPECTTEHVFSRRVIQ